MENENDPLAGVDPTLADLVRQVQKNLAAELQDLNKLPAKYTRATGMIDPDLDISTVPYEPGKEKERG